MRLRGVIVFHFVLLIIPLFDKVYNADPYIYWIQSYPIDEYEKLRDCNKQLLEDFEFSSEDKHLDLDYIKE